MRVTMRTIWISLLLATGLATAAEAQARRSGLWGNLGLGWGSLGISCDGCSGADRESALAGNAAIGGTVSPRLLIGVESDGWSKEESGVTLTSWNLSGVAYYYLGEQSGVFLKGGLGVGGWTASASGDSDTESGLGFIVGFGDDLPVGRKISITPALTYRWSEIVGDLKQNVVQVTVSVTFH